MKISRRVLPLILAFALVLGNVAMLPNPARAASLTNSYLQLNRMATSTGTSARLVIKTVGAGATSVTINMNGGDATTWTSANGAVNTTQAVSSASCAAETGATALPGTLAASGSGPTISITGVTALSASTSYCVDLTSATAVTTPSSVGEYHPVVTAGSDSATLSVRVIGNDQVVVSAVVPPTFNFVLSGNTDNFTTNLSIGSVGTTTGITATVNTNAKTGWIAWAKGANTGLNSSSVSKTIPATTPGTSATLSAGSEGYALGIATIAQGTGGGTTSASTAYDATGSAHGSGVDGSFRQIASSNGSANNAVLTIKEHAAISATTPAASDYTDTVTLIAAGNF